MKAGGEIILDRLWVFDFDGTLSEIVPDRHEAVINDSCLAMLKMIRSGPRQEAAIVSSRMLSDLIPRIPIDNILLAGCSGTEWRLPDGEIRTPSAEVFKQAMAVRMAILPIISAIRENMPTIDIEDKIWTIAIHTRRATSEQLAGLRDYLTAINSTPGVRVYHGPASVEFVLLPQSEKVNALKQILRLLGAEIGKTEVVYVGDDENDEQAMKWLLERGGKVVIVGNRIKLEGAVAIDAPRELPETIFRISKLGRPISKS